MQELLRSWLRTLLLWILPLVQRAILDEPEAPSVPGVQNSSAPHQETQENSKMSSEPSLLHGAHDFVIKNSPITVQTVRGDHDLITIGMGVLLKRIIEGAEHDSSLRDPPPKCHPGTRVQLLETITAWFKNNEREKALLWLNGPAGVGKSAVVQTFAESLHGSKQLGATLFFSRLNDRRDPQRAFTTVAFQLATRIPTYQIYITEKLATNPTLLTKNMTEQFKIFIAEPFGNKEIGKGEGPWGVLLDGLDECEGGEEQCRIIQLVSEFVLNFPHAPLVWSISSRPEPDILNTFTSGAAGQIHWPEEILINSTQACLDVECYLNSSFESMRKKYDYLPHDWPSNFQFLKLANGASGLFVFAGTAVRFIEDSNYADPESRLDLLLSVIDHPDIKVVDDHPFTLLDALYTEILKAIPPSLWKKTKRILGYILCTQPSSVGDGLSYPLGPLGLVGASIILGLSRGQIYGSLRKLYSVLEIPPPEAHGSNVSFLHASFGDYLADRNRSKDFWVDRGESVDEVTHRLYKLWLDKPWERNDWAPYTSHLSSRKGPHFYARLKSEANSSLYYAVSGILRTKRGTGPFRDEQDRSGCLDILSRINTATLYQTGYHELEFTDFLFDLWAAFSNELDTRKLCKQIRLQDLEINHLDCERNQPIYFVEDEGNLTRVSPDSNPVLDGFISWLRLLQQVQPDAFVLVCGSTLENRNAFIRLLETRNYFCIPYPYPF